MNEYQQLLVTGLSVGSIYAAVALGFTLIVRVTGMLNFAQGEYVTLAGLTSISLSANGVPLIVVAFCAIGIGTLAAVVTFMCAIRWTAKGTQLQLLMITIGLGSALRGLSLIEWGPKTKYTNPFISGGPLVVLGARVSYQTIITMVTLAAALLIVSWFLIRTRVGLALRAVASDQFIAKSFGVRSTRIYVLAFAISGALAGLAAFLIAPSTGMNYETGFQLTTMGLSAAVLGGFGSLPGAAVGGLVLGVLEAYGAKLSSAYQDAILFGFVIFVLLAFPDGLLRRRKTSPAGL